MTLRMIELVLDKKEAPILQAALKKYEIFDLWELPLSHNKILLRIVVAAEKSDEVVDYLDTHYAKKKKERVVISPIQATLPRPIHQSTSKKTKSKSENISREELYENVKDLASCSKMYISMLVLSTIIAAIGLHHNSVVIIIGAMVIAPMLGPSMALALGTTLGDLPLLKQAGLTNLMGIALVLLLSTIIGSIADLEPSLPEILSRTKIQRGDIAVALASGCAGALAFTTGISATLIGVMVAVSLLPPLVTCGILIGSSETTLAFGALLIFIMNTICINLAAVATFLIKGIYPKGWRERKRANKASIIAIALWVWMLGILVYHLLTS